MHRYLCTLTWLGLYLLIGGGATWATSGSVSGSATPTIPIEELKPGQRGFGLSVFSGTEPERFEVEVVGVWENVKPGISFLLAKLEGHGLEKSGVIAGMSGSPVYFDGRLAGAVAFSWPFSNEAIAGITPIGAMRRQSRVSLSRTQRPVGAAPLEPADFATGEFPLSLLTDQLRIFSGALFGDAQAGVQWNSVGFGPKVLDLLAANLGSVVPAGTTHTDLPSELPPGASVAGVLVDGDLRMAVTGTVTDREDEQVLAFGHQFMGVGPLELPMATSSVVTVISNQLTSFKIANIGQVVGAFDMDRATGVRGQLGLVAPTLPVRIAVQSEPVHEFNLDIARIPKTTAVLVAISALAALESSSQTGGIQGLDMEARLSIQGEGVLEIKQSFDGEAASLQSAVYLLAFTGYLLDNPLKRVELESIEVDLKQYESPRTATLLEAYAAQTRVYPGQRLKLNLEFSAYRGGRFRRSVEVQVPASVPFGRYSLLVGDGSSIDAARFSLEKPNPTNFSQAMRFLRSLHSRNELVVLGFYGGDGIRQGGEVLPDLPASIKSIWQTSGTSSVAAVNKTVAHEEAFDFARPLTGLIRIDLTVEAERSRDPE